MSATFTITQTPTSKNLWLYPNGDYHSGCTAVGAANNYQCVDDPYDIPDEDATYTWCNRTSTITDMYTLQNHTTETGTINYVRVYSRAKSYLYAQAATGLYRILAWHSGTTARSSDFDLTTDYNNFSLILTTTPSGAAWNWTAVDNLRIGWDATSPGIPLIPSSLTIRPNGAGANTNLTPVPVVANYLNVDETSQDGFSTYVYHMGTTRTTDLYAMQNHTIESGTITGINIFAYIRGYYILNPYANLSIRTTTGPTCEGTRFWVNFYDWTNYSYNWTSNPTTSVAWSWAEVDNLQCGVTLWGSDPATWSICTQLYAVVNYLANIYPQIHTTQMYARVNYSPSSGSCFLNVPRRYGISNSRKICIVQPERGNRVVYDLCRESKVLNMEGVETSTTTSRLLCVRNMKDNGEYVTISGMGDDKVDTTWLITDFVYDRDETSRGVWHWNLTAEKYENG
jgi:hypothetical protein